jgi:hypothetical protein
VRFEQNSLEGEKYRESRLLYKQINTLWIKKALRHREAQKSSPIPIEMTTAGRYFDHF